jgi:hypothetical protein
MVAVAVGIGVGVFVAVGGDGNSTRVKERRVGSALANPAVSWPRAVQKVSPEPSKKKKANRQSPKANRLAIKINLFLERFCFNFFDYTLEQERFNGSHYTIGGLRRNQQTN